MAVDEEFGMEEFHPMTVRSGALLRAIYSIDDHIIGLEEDNKKLREKLKKAEDDLFQVKMDHHKALNASMANTLKVLLIGTGTSIKSDLDINDLGPMGATILTTLREMKTIEEVQQYIGNIFDKFKATEDKKNANKGTASKDNAENSNKESKDKNKKTRK